MTHSPGPWVKIRRDRLWNEIVSSTNRQIVLVQKNSAYFKVPAEETEGNATLIAAAPELLEACKAVVANLVDENGCNWCDCAVWVGNGHADWCPIPSAIAAISKAEPTQ